MHFEQVIQPLCALVSLLELKLKIVSPHRITKIKLDNIVYLEEYLASNVGPLNVDDYDDCDDDNGGDWFSN